jgi:hypothetical protein
MNFLKNIISSFSNTSSASNTTSVENNYSDGCAKCGELSFQHDTYFDEYSCDNCGWTVNEKPTGKVKIRKLIPKNKK